MIVRKVFVLGLFCMLGRFLFGQAEFRNVVVSSSEGRVRIDYDLLPSSEGVVLKAVRLWVIYKDEKISPRTLSGAVGNKVLFGTNLHLYWDCAADGRLFDGKADILLEADCETLPPPSQSFEPEMVFVEGGTFQMGSNEGGIDEKPVHWVRVGSFSIGKYEVTQAQWRAVMGSDPVALSFKGCDQCPVEGVSWDDIQQFLSKLTRMTGKRYRLPTEAEWEYAARGGNSSKGYKYSGSNDVGAVAWYWDNADRKTHPVGTKQANELGLHDMSGNVYEWCSDGYSSDYSLYSSSDSSSSSSAVSNPTGAATGAYRVLRGGSWNYPASNVRVANRLYNTPTLRHHSLGLRVVLLPF